MKEELLDLVSLPNTTTGQDISGALIEVLKKRHMPLDRISSIAIDQGCPHFSSLRATYDMTKSKRSTTN